MTDQLPPTGPLFRFPTFPVPGPWFRFPGFLVPGSRFRFYLPPGYQLPATDYRAIASIIASAIRLVPTAVGSSRLGFMS